MTDPLPSSRVFADSERLAVSIELTNVCNFRCPICPVSFRKDKAAQPAGAPYDRPYGYMEDAVFERAVDECRRTARTVNFSFFGEQTLHPHYARLMRTLRGQPFARDLNTNMGMVTPEIMQAWIDAEFDLVRISLDAITPEVFNSARPGRVIGFDGRPVAEADRMAVVNEKVRRWLAMPGRRPTQLVFVKSQHNDARELAAFVDHWRPFLTRGDRILAKRILSYGGKIADPNVVAHRCNVWEVRYLMIDWQGNASPCNLDTNMDLRLGNIMEHSVEELYWGERADGLRLRTGCLKDLSPCRTCSDGNNWESSQVWEPASAE